MDSVNIEAIVIYAVFFIPIVVFAISCARTQIKIDELESMRKSMENRREEIKEKLRGPFTIETISDEPAKVERVRLSHAEGPPVVQTTNRIPTNCPNCGAVIDPSNCKCEYCDTPYPWALDRKRLVTENEVLKIKTEAYIEAESIRQLYEEALRAMRRYEHTL
jgi:hypothetical protein